MEVRYSCLKSEEQTYFAVPLQIITKGLCGNNGPKKKTKMSEEIGCMLNTLYLLEGMTLRR